MNIKIVSPLSSSGLTRGSKKYKCHKLVYFEETNSIEEAIKKEKQLKKWNRQWKMRLIEDFNPKWKDLYDNID